MKYSGRFPLCGCGIFRHRNADRPRLFARPMRCTARPSWISRRVTAPSKDPLIGKGTAPLDDPLFRSAIFEQHGGAKLEGVIQRFTGCLHATHASLPGKPPVRPQTAETFCFLFRVIPALKQLLHCFDVCKKQFLRFTVFGLRLYLLVVLRVRRTTCAPLRAVAPLRSATALFPVALSIPDLTRTARRGHGDRETNGGHRHIGPCDPRARNDSYLRATCANRAEVWLTDSECHANTWTSPFTAEREDRCNVDVCAAA
jgi:hypothetical protein